MAPCGHGGTQSPQPVQRAASTTARFAPKPSGRSVSSVTARGAHGGTHAPHPVHAGVTKARRCTLTLPLSRVRPAMATPALEGPAGARSSGARLPGARATRSRLGAPPRAPSGRGAAPGPPVRVARSWDCPRSGAWIASIQPAVTVRKQQRARQRDKSLRALYPSGARDRQRAAGSDGAARGTGASSGGSGREGGASSTAVRAASDRQTPVSWKP